MPQVQHDNRTQWAPLILLCFLDFDKVNMAEHR